MNMQQRLTIARLVHLAALLALPVLLAGCPGPYHPLPSLEPLYMSWEELRSAVHMEGPRPLGRSGKIWVHGQYLLVNEPNLGIHLFDNVDPAKPVNLGFLSIPGNLDIAVQDDVVYADSFTDLVAIQLDGAAIVKVSRRESVFPYDAYQAIGDHPALQIEDGDEFGGQRAVVHVDESKGVVIGIVGDDKSPIERRLEE